MESQQMMELLLKEIRAGQEENRINQAKMDANMKAWREKVEADRKIDQEERKATQEKAETHHKDFLAGMDADSKAWREEMAAVRSNWANNNHNETLACREMTEERQEEKKPTSPDRKPEAHRKQRSPQKMPQ
jgi:hypothetical protein